MKTLSDGFRVNSRSYYFLLDWNDENDRRFIKDNFKKNRLCDLNKDEYLGLWLHATTSDYNEMI